MLAVRIYKLNKQFEDEEVGAIVLDDGRLRAIPPTPFLNSFLTEPIFGPSTGKRRITPSEDPLLFLHTLHEYYRSPYLLAGNVEEIDVSNTIHKEFSPESHVSAETPNTDKAAAKQQPNGETR